MIISKINYLFNTFVHDTAEVEGNGSDELGNIQLAIT